MGSPQDARPSITEELLAKNQKLLDDNQDLRNEIRRQEDKMREAEGIVRFHTSDDSLRLKKAKITKDKYHHPLCYYGRWLAIIPVTAIISVFVCWGFAIISPGGSSIKNVWEGFAGMSGVVAGITTALYVLMIGWTDEAWCKDYGKCNRAHY